MPTLDEDVAAVRADLEKALKVFADVTDPAQAYSHVAVRAGGVLSAMDRLKRAQKSMRRVVDHYRAMEDAEGAGRPAGEGEDGG